LTRVIDTERRLVAVFAADVEGYSRLMGADEIGTLRGLTERRAILDQAIADHRGRIANTAGDSVLAGFASAVDAVQCAVEVQPALAEANSNLPPEKHINFRIGVHVGDVMVRGGDLFGDGVNIAARLQALARPGTVCVSGATYDQVRKVLPFAFADLGAQQVKNIEEPVRAYITTKIGDAGVAAASADISKLLPLPDKPSIAVLPFQNMSGDSDQEYFADGMVEDIITALSRFKSLFVIARNSSFTYKGKTVDIKQIGRELGVRYVLEGSVRKVGGRVRVTGQLLDAQTNLHVWADQFDGDIADIFALQDNITQAVVGIIVPTIQLAEMEQARRARPQNLDAYDLYLRGLWLHNQMATPESLVRSVQFYNQAIQTDPTFVAPLFEAALVCIVEVSQGWVSPLEGFPHAMSYAERALRLDPNDSDVLATVAFVGAVTRGARDEWVAMSTRAIALNPNSAFAYARSGWVRTCSAKPETAIAHFERALRLSPKDMANWDVWTGLGYALLQANRDDDAIAAAYLAIQHGPNFSFAWRLLIAATALSGRLSEMRPAVARLAELEPNFRVGPLRQWGDLINPAAFARVIEGLLKAGLPE
jgi:adenylate cyclase